MNKYNFIASKDTFHFLVDRLRITPESEALEKRFKEFQKESDNYSDLADMEEFAKQENDKGNDDWPITENTANGDSAVDQALQFTEFMHNNKPFVILQIHGGADVRGGYTTPYIFELDNELGLFDHNDLHAKVGNKEWHSDDGGYNWHFCVPGSPEDPKDDTDKEGQPFPENWEITKEGVFYKPTGEPVSFEDGKQWWEDNPKLAKKWKRLKA